MAGKFRGRLSVISMTARLIELQKRGGNRRESHIQRAAGLDGKRLKLVSANTVPVLPQGLVGGVKQHWEPSHVKRLYD